MDLQKIVKVSRKLAAVIEKEFPFIFEDDAREAVAKMIIELHYEPKVMPELFADKWKDDLI